MSAASREQRWVLKAELAVVATEDRVVSLDLDHPDVPPMVREGTAWTIWSALGEREMRQGSTNALANAYGVAPEGTFADVEGFVARMLSAEVIVEA